jgi:FixJ family two-component response regulator
VLDLLAEGSSNRMIARRLQLSEATVKGHVSTDLDLNPVIARPDGAFAVHARVKVAPSEPHDPFLRKLR